MNTSNRDGIGQLYGFRVVRPHIFCMLARLSLTYCCAAADSNHVFTQPRPGADVLLKYLPIGNRTADKALDWAPVPFSLAAPYIGFGQGKLRTG